MPRRRFTVAEIEAPTAGGILQEHESPISSLNYDLGRKAGLYAVFGIAELCVVNAVTLQTRVHREPTPAGYRACRAGPRPRR